jgi:hypothetical protein
MGLLPPVLFIATAAEMLRRALKRELGEQLGPGLAELHKVRFKWVRLGQSSVCCSRINPERGHQA